MVRGLGGIIPMSNTVKFHKAQNFPVIRTGFRARVDTSNVEFDQVLLADDLARLFSWLGRGVGRVSVFGRVANAYPRITFLAALLVAFLVTMYGFAAVYFGVI